MARDEARKADEKTDIAENTAIAEQFDELRARKGAMKPEEKARLAEARERAKFVRGVMPAPNQAEVRLQSAPHLGDIVMPVTEDQATDAWDSQKQLRELEASEIAFNAEMLKQDGEAYQYFVRCRSCYRHAIYLTEPVTDGQVIKDGMWFARYKPDPSTIWRQRILCQRCLMEGVERDISINFTNWRLGQFTVETRWLRKTPKDPLRAGKEGSTRACEMPMTSQNVIGTIPDPVGT